MIHDLDIGSVKLANNLILAPMAGVSDGPFRLLCSEQGAGLVCMEMISAKALTYHNKKTEDLLRTQPEERPVSLQLFGSDPGCMEEAVHLIDDRDYDILDINMGCPVPKVVKNGEGSALMKDPKLAHMIIQRCVKASSKPVTVKIRKGFDEDHVNAAEIAGIAEEAGAAAVAVHGRTREQYYSGTADWDIIARVKQEVSIPVIGNGDLTDADSVRRMYEHTGCDGFMIARAARGDPWIFDRILNNNNGPKPPFNVVADMLLRHARLQIEWQGEYIGIRQMRKHAAWYVAGYPGAAGFRGAINEICTYEQLKSVINSKEDQNGTEEKSHDPRRLAGFRG